jgi:hypothetical protein
MTHPIEQLLKAARSARPTQADREEMRRSFAFGNTALENKHITREMIDQEAEKLAREKNEQRPT